MLHEISRLLWWLAYETSKPSVNQPPWWLPSTFSILLSAIVGFLTGLVGQWFVTDYLGRCKIRRLLYVDLATMFRRVDDFSRTDPSEIGAWHPEGPLRWQHEQLRKTLDFGIEKHCLNSPQFYFQLPERFAGQTLYQGLHQLLDDPTQALNLNAHSVIQKFVFYVCSGPLEKRRFREFLSKKEANDLLLLVDEYHRQHEEMMQRNLAKATSQVRIHEPPFDEWI